MTTGEKLEQQLQNVLSGHPWYGYPVYRILEEVTFETAYEKPAGASHNIIEILLHMISWTEEVLDNLNGKEAGLPVSGDWPPVGDPDEEKLKLYIDDLKLVNVNLIGVIRNFPEDQWTQQIIDHRGTEPVVTYEELVTGLIQHHIYHSAQIALLKRILNG